jgi:hypothetical protein
LTSALYASCLIQTPATPENPPPPMPIGYEARWAPELLWSLWSRENLFAPVTNQTPAIQPVAHHYNDMSYPELPCT